MIDSRLLFSDAPVDLGRDEVLLSKLQRPVFLDVTIEAMIKFNAWLTDSCVGPIRLRIVNVDLDGGRHQVWNATHIIEEADGDYIGLLLGGITVRKKQVYNQDHTFEYLSMADVIASIPELH